MRRHMRTLSRSGAGPMGYRREAECSGGARTAEVRRVLWLVLFLNVAVAAGKYFYGLFIGSVSMQADGFHSLFDGTSNVVGPRRHGARRAPRRPGPPLRPRQVRDLRLRRHRDDAAASPPGRSARRPWASSSTAGAPPGVDAAAFGVMIVTLAVNICVPPGMSAEGQSPAQRHARRRRLATPPATSS